MIKSLLHKMNQPIDYVGQEMASKLMYIVFAVGYTLALVVGIFLNDLKYTILIGVLTVVIAIVVVVPPWKIYRRNPLKFSSPSKAKAE
ncbi:hypothetical protein CWI42_030150 [Ordospora colligata]|uniref:Signal peptidase complex subunit 1 n=1 Tax=Ordospora colligata OC4 TaxID=1354746 RepID=A0A0B2UM63_9MICR|nr:uncharacterized protein M896_031340 [Ordospora colligata OC4]KHN70147.1 hypothetical protein M896_031340 [Ordospora colligata OC4]TBU16529.1 hypothetical protein CWI41_031300 [Ordospora colligata]TBU16570.1 hypothetical protein CWI40_030220 [Ordospora colligata]TBU19143.1 hypothetical protein CWI42_030150 [Ordospora colligata]